MPLSRLLSSSPVTIRALLCSIFVSIAELPAFLLWKFIKYSPSIISTLHALNSVNLLFLIKGNNRIKITKVTRANGAMADKESDAEMAAEYVDVLRYELPQQGAFNFVMRSALGGGVTRSLALDAHGKSLSCALLSMQIPDPPKVVS